MSARSIGDAMTWSLLEVHLHDYLDQLSVKGDLLARVAYGITNCTVYKFSPLTDEFIMEGLFEWKEYIRKIDYSLYLGILTGICLNNFGTTTFQREFISLDNMKHLANINSIEHMITSAEIKNLVNGLTTHLIR